jgi:MFS family permease
MGHQLARSEDLARAVARVFRDMVAGIRAVVSRPAARLPLIGVFIVRVAAMVAAITAIIIIKDHFPDAGDRFGRLSSSALALGAAGVGAFMAALSAPRLGRRLSEPLLMLVGFVIAGAGIIALGGISDIVAVLGLTFLGGFGGFVAKVAVDAQVQRALPDEFRGRAFALYDILYNLATVVAAALLLTAEDASLRVFCAALGVTILLFAGALASALRRAGLLAV